jgi:hypothetical protein
MASMIETITSPLKAASETLEKMLAIKGVLEHGDEIRKLHENVVTGLKAAAAWHVQQIAMQDEIDSLKRKVVELEVRNAKLDQYETKELPPGVFVMVLKPGVQISEGVHRACQKCHQDGKIYPLQSRGTHRGLETLHCQGCGSELQTGHFEPPKPVQTRTRYNPFGLNRRG